MNYLAHLYLSGNVEDIVIGNFIGDAVRGDQYKRLKPVRRVKKRMWHVFGRYSSVVADVFLDHFLARDWETYHPQSLEAYADSVEAMLRPRLAEFPERSRRFFDYMIQNQVLLGYASIIGTGKVLTQMAQRARFESHMEHGAAELSRCYEAYRQDFRAFFPELCAFVQTRQVEIPQGK